MQFNHMVAAVLDPLNSNRHMPKAIVIHAGESDFGAMPQYLVKFFTAQMSNTIHDLIHHAQQYRHRHIMLPQQWYIGWSTQKATKKVRARFNSCLARA